MTECFNYAIYATTKYVSKGQNTEDTSYRHKSPVKTADDAQNKHKRTYTSDLTLFCNMGKGCFVFIIWMHRLSAKMTPLLLTLNCNRQDEYMPSNWILKLHCCYFSLLLYSSVSLYKAKCYIDVRIQHCAFHKLVKKTLVLSVRLVKTCELKQYI